MTGSSIPTADIISFQEARRNRGKAQHVSGGSGYGHRRECLMGDVVSLGFATVTLCAVCLVSIGLSLMLWALA